MSKSTKRTPHDKFTIRLRPVGLLARFAANAALAGYVDLTACLIDQMERFCERTKAALKRKGKR